MSSSMSGYRGSATGSVGSPRTMERNKIPKGYGYGQIAQYTPEQMELFRHSLGQVGEGSYLSRLAGGDESLFAEMEAPALRQFSGLQGNIASRFSGMGLGARQSSGFKNTMNAAASNFAQDLQSRRQELQRQAIRDLQGMRRDLLQERPYDRFIAEEKNQPLGGWGGAIGAGVGGVGGFLASGGNPYMAYAGAQIGHAAGSGL